MAKNFFLESFRKQGFTDTGFSAWAKRKAGAPRGRGRALLVDTGALRRSIKVRLATFKKIIVGTTGVKYARYHNEGISPQPKREFIGESKTLERKLRKRIELEINKVFT